MHVRDHFRFTVVWIIGLGKEVSRNQERMESTVVFPIFYTRKASEEPNTKGKQLFHYHANCKSQKKRNIIEENNWVILVEY